MQSKPENRGLVWLATVLAINVFLTMGIVCALVLRGDTINGALATTALGRSARLLQPTWDDSWYPMLKAYQRKVEQPEKDLYSIFFDEGVKFQYPPASLLFFDLLPSSMTTVTGRPVDGPLRPWLRNLSLVAVLLTVLASAGILKIGLDRLRSGNAATPMTSAALVMMSLVLGLTYYPLVVGHNYGQIQVFLNALIAFALLFRLLGWEVLSGVCFGVCLLVKPQYGVILLWAMLRKQWRFTLGLASVLLLGFVVSILRFGLPDHLQYLQVIQWISQRGESIWVNQSINGLLHRLLGNGSPIEIPGAPQSDFAPYHPAVHIITVITCLGILTVALWPHSRRQREDRGLIDLMVVLVGATLASPVAWNHHYGALLPVFACVLPILLQTPPLGRLSAPVLALSYVMMANLVHRWEWFFVTPVRGLLASHLFFGSVVFFALLVVMRSRTLQPCQLSARAAGTSRSIP